MPTMPTALLTKYTAVKAAPWHEACDTDTRVKRDKFSNAGIMEAGTELTNTGQTGIWLPFKARAHNPEPFFGEACTPVLLRICWRV